IQTAKTLQQEYQLTEVDPMDILRWPGVMSVPEHDLDELSTILLVELEKVIDQIIEVREREGQAIKQLIEQRLQPISGQIQIVRTLMPEILQWQRTKLLSRLEDLTIQLDHDRLEQELALLAQRIDVEEELDRLAVHVKETYQVLTKNEAVGRRLDF